MQQDKSKIISRLRLFMTFARVEQLFNKHLSKLKSKPTNPIQNGSLKTAHF
jgi:hypothetical protein